MTPEEFENEMEEIVFGHYDSFGNDVGGRHEAMDDLMCRVLAGLGYGAGVDIFERQLKWYS